MVIQISETDLAIATVHCQFKKGAIEADQLGEVGRREVMGYV